MTDLSYAFCNCSSLKVLPDISKWNVSKVISMNYLFYKTNLKKKPNLTNWNVKNLVSALQLYDGYDSLFDLFGRSIFSYPKK